MTYLFENIPTVLRLFAEHLGMTAITLLLALAIAFPLGLVVARVRTLRGPVMAALGAVYTIPSLAMFVLLIPLLGLGMVPAVVALVAYAQFVLVRNWSLGLTSIDPSILEAADGMGMGGWARFWQVEFPLALPLLVAGLRLAALSTIGIATVAAFINAGGLGALLFEGVITNNAGKITAGAVAVSLLAVGVNGLFHWIERLVEV